MRTASRRLRFLCLAGAVLLASWLLSVGPVVTAPAPPDKSPPKAVLRDSTWKPGQPSEVRFLIEQATLLKSRTVLEKVVAKPAVSKLETIKEQRDPHGWLRANLQVDVDEEKGTLTVRLLRGHPKEQAALIDAVADVFLAESAKRLRGPIEERINNLSKQRASRATDAERVRHKVKAGVGDPEMWKASLRIDENALRHYDRIIKHLREEMLEGRQMVPSKYAGALRPGSESGSGKKR